MVEGGLRDRTIKRYHEGNLCGDGIVLNLDWAGDHTNLHMWIKWHRPIQTHRTNIKSYVGYCTKIMQYVTIGRNHWVKCTQDLSVLSFAASCESINIKKKKKKLVKGVGQLAHEQ